VRSHYGGDPEKQWQGQGRQEGLNEYVKRENHPLPAVDTTLGRLAGSRVFSKLDANSGFWQIKLALESRPLPTFFTPWGRFCFNVLPFGVSSGSEKFQKNMSQIL